MAVSQEALTILLPLYMLDIGASPAFAALVVGLRGIGVLLVLMAHGIHASRAPPVPPETLRESPRRTFTETGGQAALGLTVRFGSV